MPELMLQSRWELRDVPDVERLCRAVIREQTGASHDRGGDRGRGPNGARPGNGTRIRLELADHDEALAYLLGEVVTLERRYVHFEGGSFRGYLFYRLRFAFKDWLRSFYGRHGQHRLIAPELAVRPRDLRVAGEPVDDSAADWADDLGGLYGGADRGVDGPVGVVGARPGEGTRPADLRGGAGESGSAGGAAGAAGGAFVDCSCGWRTYRQAPNGQPGWHWPEACVGCGQPVKAAA